MKNFITHLCALMLLCLAGDVQGNNTYGGELTYKFLGGTKYKITASVYRNCQGLAFTNDPSFGVFAGTNGQNGCGSYSLSGFSRVAIRSMNYLCKGASDPCNPSNTFNTGNGLEEHVYEGVVDFSSSPLKNFVNNSSCCEVTFYMSHLTRPSSLNNGGSGNTFYLTATLNICNLRKSGSSGNNQVDWTLKPNHKVCLNSSLSLDHGAVDTNDHDRLTFRLVDALGTLPQTSISYSTGYSGRYPVTPYCVGGGVNCTPNAGAKPPRGISFDTVTGTMVYAATKAESALVCLEVTDWKKDSTGKWIWVGKSRREFIVQVRDDCGYNNYPELSGLWSMTVCEGEKICAQYNLKDAVFSPFQTAADTVRLNWNGTIPKASFTILNPSAREKTGEFCWQTKAGDAREVPYRFHLTGDDRFCPNPGVVQNTVLVYVVPKSKAKRYYKDSSCNILRARAENAGGPTSGLSWSWEVKDSMMNVVGKASGQAPDISIGPFKGRWLYVSLVVTNGNKCSVTYIDTVYFSQPPLLQITPKSVSICKADTFQVSLKVSNTTRSISSVQWSVNGLTVKTDTSTSLRWPVQAAGKVNAMVLLSGNCKLNDSAGISLISHNQRLFTSIPPACWNATPTDITRYINTPRRNGSAAMSSSPAGIVSANGSGGWQLVTSKYDNLKMQNGTSETGKVYLSYTDSQGCKYKDSTSYRVNGAPIVQLRDGIETCLNPSGYLLSDLVIRPKLTIAVEIDWVINNVPSGVDPKTVLTDPTAAAARLLNGKSLNSYAGFYTLDLGIKDRLTGCIGRDTNTITLKPIPVMTQENLGPYCAGATPVNLGKEVTVSPAGTFNYRILAFDGDKKSPNIALASINAGLFNAKRIAGNWQLEAISALSGCYDTMEFLVRTLETPLAAFTSDKGGLTTKADPVFNMVNNSTGKGVLGYQWLMPGALKSADTAKAPVITYSDTGNYRVTLIATGDNGCTDTAIKVLRVEQTLSRQMAAAGQVRLGARLQVLNADAGHILISVYNLSGQHLGNFEGKNGIPASALSPGVYLYRLSADIGGREQVQTGRYLHLSE